MRRILAAICGLFLCLATPGQAQTLPDDAGIAQAAVVRILDRLTGELLDITLDTGETFTQGVLTVSVSQCRYPKENPVGNAFAYVEIDDSFIDGRVFEGWMSAASPALNGLDHSRYDLWVLRCANIS